MPRRASKVDGGESRSAPQSKEARDRLAIIDVVRPVRFIVPNPGSRNSQRAINRSGHVLGRVWLGGRVSADAIGGADHAAALDSTAGKKRRLNSAPVVAARLAID